MPRALLSVLLLAAMSFSQAQVPPSGLAVHPAVIDPFWPELDSPKLTTPEWIGEKGVDAAITISIDDMRDTQKYEVFIRPILEKLKEVSGGRAPFSIFTCEVPPDDPQLQAWLKEGVSIEVHTLKHPCPLLQKGDFAAAKATVDGCIDLLSQIPGGKPVCFRMPCCDSMSSPSPRFYAEIFHKTTPAGNSLTLDSSVACILTSKDKTVPRELSTDAQGRDRFWKYYHPQPANAVKSMQNFGTYIEDYPYPYVIGDRCWELPITMPSDWLAQNFQGKNNPATVGDWKAALDIIVLKKGTMNLCIHPHGWIQAAQMVEFIQYAHEKYGSRVKFLSMRDAGERLARLDISKHRTPSRKIPEAPLPDGVTIADAQGRDNGVRFVDLNGDGYDDIVFSNAERYGVYIYNPTEKKNVDWRVGWTFVMREGKAGDANSIPQIVRADGTNNGVWFKHGSMWVQNEDTDKLPGVVRRIPYERLLKQPGPPPRSPEESLRAIHVKKGFVAELVAREPLVQDPIFIDWDEKGRMWVVEMADYPLGMDGNGKPGGRIKILEDTNADGVYDKVSLFLDNLQHPTGLAPWKNGIFALAGGELFFAADTDGDGKADLREIWYTGFNKGNSQHLANGLCWGLDGWFYGANGDSGGKIQSVKGGGVHDLSGRDFRFNPRTREFQLQPGKTQCGRWRDDYGNWFGSNNSSMGWHYFMDERYLARNPKLAVPTLRRVMNSRDDNKRVFPIAPQMRRYNWPDAVNTLTSACNAMPYRDTLFGKGYRNSIFVCEPANNLVHREVLEPDGISFTGHRADDEKDSEFLASEDPWFRPTMARTGPDGCLYVVDMYRLVLEHPEWIPRQMQAHMDLRAGEDRGRIYRIRPEGFTPATVAKPGDTDEEQLAEALKSGNGWLRDTAQRLFMQMHGRGSRTASAKLREIVTSPRLPVPSQIQALSTLLRKEWLDDGKDLKTSLAFALDSSTPVVRAYALRNMSAEHKDEGTLLRLQMLSRHPDFRVRHAAALALGEYPDDFAVILLAEMLVTDGGNPDMITAVLSSASGKRLTLIVRSLASLGDRAPAKTVSAITQLALAGRDDDALTALFDAGMKMKTHAGSPTSTWTQALDEAIEEHGVKKYKDWQSFVKAMPPRFQERLQDITRLPTKPNGDAKQAPTPVIITNASPDREKVVKQYATAAKLTGNPTTGHALYTNVCSACHRLKNEGTEIGPDLGMVAAKPVEQIIEAILDPNRAVEARYTTQTLATKQGRDVIGLVIEETPNSLTVRTATGVETILRADISKRSGNTKSLMPEGLENLLTPQHVADILAWIRQK